jgi:hypothetical protein
LSIVPEYPKDKKLEDVDVDADGSHARLLGDLKRTREGLLYSEARVQALTERGQERDKVVVLCS